MAHTKSHLSADQRKRIRKALRDKIWAPEIRKVLRPLRKANLVLIHNILKFESKDFFLKQIREVYRQKYKTLLGVRRYKS